MMKKIFTNILLITNLFIFGQTDSARMIKYTPEFKFKEGVFLNFEQVKTNSPIPKTRIISEVDYEDNNFFESILGKKNIYFYDHIGTRSEVKTKFIWGYSRNGFLFIGVNQGYYRITMVGSICHFVSYYTYEVPNSNYPYSYDPYYRDPYRYSPHNYTTSSEMRQYLFDFNSGKVFEYSKESLEILLMQDPELYDEYMDLSGKKKKQMKFLYMRKFNERNPLFFPDN